MRHEYKILQVSECCIACMPLIYNDTHYYTKDVKIIYKKLTKNILKNRE
ncbi:hypothetical protein HMPREF3033_01635 [Veillonellaceae bacterium DNF00751]|uniref:Uncharacterized protein n=1 Tax=Megasphaera lornae TaxID=1000568 RepID=D3LWR8_9FIRM|nr:hypothetical protein HMPREF0889_0726 [Megasphaera genomosp. type_1 str. 28L]EGL40314.1 hypothetical protein HMPREF1039_0691 [Megasphaera lornae]KXB89956.1 hypothetical protein HMPREF3033_01635 [Veillonellaceae bacterium DNF00751]